MDISLIVVLSILGGLWCMGIMIYVVAWIKTRTKPGELPRDKLFEKAFGVKNNDKSSSNSDNTSL